MDPRVCNKVRLPSYSILVTKKQVTDTMLQKPGYKFPIAYSCSRARLQPQVQAPGYNSELQNKYRVIKNQVTDTGSSARLQFRVTEQVPSYKKPSYRYRFKRQVTIPSYRTSTELQSQVQVPSYSAVTR